MSLSNMGMYTELIFGASLKKETPEEVIETLKYLIGDRKDRPKESSFESPRDILLFTGASYYFGVNQSVSKMWRDNYSKQWAISTRANLKNYEDDIEKFLEWIKPWIDSGSGYREMYAIVLYEEFSEPTIYYLHDSA